MNQHIKSVLKVASEQLGVREQGNNRGARVEQYLGSVRLPPGNPWCAAFVYWCFKKVFKTAADTPFPRTGYCPTIGMWAKDHKILYIEPKAGDVFLVIGRVNGVTRFCHTGFVTAVRGSSFDTIEGNTNVEGSREGVGVFSRTRIRGQSYRFVRVSEFRRPAKR